jgi:hypothetical protein
LALLYVNFLFTAPMPTPGRQRLRGICHISPPQAQLETKHKRTSPAHRLFYILVSSRAREDLAWGIKEFTFRSGVSERERERDSQHSRAEESDLTILLPSLIFSRLDSPTWNTHPVSWPTVISISRSVIVKSLVQRPPIRHAEHNESLCYCLLELSELYASVVYTFHLKPRQTMYVRV